MSLSIIIPTLNEAEHIGALLADLAPLRAEGAELILVDGGSSDATLARAGTSVDLVLNAPRGRAAQMNTGARAARGDLLWFLHADTRVPDAAPAALRQVFEAAACPRHPDQTGDECPAVNYKRLIFRGGPYMSLRGRPRECPGERLCERFRSRFRGCFRGCFWGRFDVRLSGRHPLLRLVERGMNWRSRLTGIATGDQGIFVSRAAFERVGGFPPLALMEDIALSAALRRLARPVCLRARLLSSSRRWETRGVLRTILLMWRLRLAYALGADPARLARRYGNSP